MDDDKYNGWANYATWRVQLEIVDDYVSSIDGEDGKAWSEMSVGELADQIKEYVEECLTGFGDWASEDYTGQLVLSYARAFVDDCDWYEMAEHAQESAREMMSYE